MLLKTAVIEEPVAVLFETASIGNPITATQNCRNRGAYIDQFVVFFFGSGMYYFIVVDILFYCDVYIILLC